jgi:hypothetical protein
MITYFTTFKIEFFCSQCCIPISLGLELTKLRSLLAKQLIRANANVKIKQFGHQMGDQKFITSNSSELVVPARWAIGSSHLYLNIFLVALIDTI